MSLRRRDNLRKHQYASEWTAPSGSRTLIGPVQPRISGTNDEFTGGWVGRIKGGLGHTETINDATLVLLQYNKEITNVDQMLPYVEGGEILDHARYYKANNVYAVLVRVTHPQCARLTVLYGISTAICRVEKGNVWTSEDLPIVYNYYPKVAYDSPLGSAGMCLFMQVKFGDLTQVETNEMVPLASVAWVYNFKFTDTIQGNVQTNTSFNLRIHPTPSIVYKIMIFDKTLAPNGEYYEKEHDLSASPAFAMSPKDGSPATFSNRTVCFKLGINLQGSTTDDCEVQMWLDTELWELHGAVREPTETVEPTYQYPNVTESDTINPDVGDYARFETVLSLY